MFSEKDVRNVSKVTVFILNKGKSIHKQLNSLAEQIFSPIFSQTSHTIKQVEIPAPMVVSRQFKECIMRRTIVEANLFFRILSTRYSKVLLLKNGGKKFVKERKK